jgi:hypothetical protein
MMTGAALFQNEAMPTQKKDQYYASSGWVFSENYSI